MSPAMSNDSEAHRRKRLLHQSRRRGTKEADLILGGFALAHMASLTSDQFARLEALLEESGPDLMNWIGGQSAPPAPHDNDILKLICSFKYVLLKK